MTSPLGAYQVTQDAMRAMVSKRDAAMSKAIADKVGVFDVGTFDMSRLTMQHWPEGLNVLLLDGEEIYRDYPMKISHENDRDSFRVNLSQQYRMAGDD